MMKMIFLAIPILVLVHSCGLTTTSAHPEEDEITLTWQFHGNHASESTYSSTFSLSNSSDQDLEGSGWALYFNVLDASVIPSTVKGNVTIEHVNGDLMKLAPTADFNLPSGSKVEISYKSRGSIVKMDRAPIGPYLVYGDSEKEEMEVVPVANYTILPFPELDKVFPERLGIPVPDAAWVFERNRHQKELDPALIGTILPSPKKAIKANGSIKLDRNTAIHYQGIESNNLYAGA